MKMEQITIVNRMGGTQKMDTMLESLSNGVSVHWVISSHFPANMQVRFGQTLQCWMRRSSLGMFTHLSEKLLSLVCADLPMKGLILEFLTPYPFLSRTECI